MWAITIFSSDNNKHQKVQNSTRQVDKTNNDKTKHTDPHCTLNQNHHNKNE